ncbi:biotin/lipoyl-binding protein, partial [Rubripirellula amarantea]|nr:biotin/lipoyl-binding protein [Rubripirellula amarantea]
MKPLHFALRLILSVAIIGGAIAAYFLLGESEVYTRPAQRKSVPQVKTIVAENHLDGLQIEVDGVVVPYRQIDLAAEVGGRVLFKSDRCRTGRTVKAGEVLIRIDPQDYELEVRRLTEELNQADATIGELEAELQTTENQIIAAREQLKIDQRQLERNL